MVTFHTGSPLTYAMCGEAGLSVADLWRRYFELGGMYDESQIEQSLRTGTFADAHEHNLVAHALNEQLSELGRSSRATYLESHPPVSALACDSSTPLVQLDLLGWFRVRRGGEPMSLAMNAQRLIAFLALNEGFLLRRHVAGSLWSETTDLQAAGCLRSTLWRLGELSPLLIEIADSHLRLAPGVSVDLAASEQVARRVLDPAEMLRPADLSDALLTQDLLPDWTEDYVLTRRDQHAQLRVRALEALCTQFTDVGRFGPAVQAGMRAVAADPLRESARRALMLAHLGEGSVAAAAKEYESIRSLLWDELGVEPSAQTKALVLGLRV